MTGVTLHQVSANARLGVKGAAAAEFLRAQGLVVPQEFNAWVERDGVLVARLGMTEFLVEEGADGGGLPSPGTARPPLPGGEAPGVREDRRQAEPLLARLSARLHEAAATATPDLYPVLRADCALILAGPLADDLLVQVCNVNFAPLARAATAAAGPLALTQMVGVSVTAAPQRQGAATSYRIWCDPTFGPYLKATLQDIANELNAGADTA